MGAYQNVTLVSQRMGSKPVATFAQYFGKTHGIVKRSRVQEPHLYSANGKDILSASYFFRINLSEDVKMIQCRKPWENLE